MRPSATSAATRRSAGVSPRSASGPEPSELGACLLDPGRRAEPLELAERRTDRVVGGALLTLAPADHAEREQRTGSPEGVVDRLVLCDRVLEKRGGLGHVSAGGCQEPPTARDVREHPHAFESSRIRLPRVDHPLGVVRPVEREQGLDVVGHPPAMARLAPAEPDGRRLRPAEPVERLVRVATLKCDNAERYQMHGRVLPDLLLQRVAGLAPSVRGRA